MSNPTEFAFASSIALQAYFEGRVLSRHDMDQCLEYWNHHIAERSDPIGRKRPEATTTISEADESSSYGSPR
jgi:hypothetical protein